MLNPRTSNCVTDAKPQNVKWRENKTDAKPENVKRRDNYTDAKPQNNKQIVSIV